jgi:transposase
MRKLREVLRLTMGSGMPERQVGIALGIGKGTVNDIVHRAKAAGVGWPIPDDLDDVALEAKLYPPRVPSGTIRPLPDWAEIHREMAKKGVTLALLWEEYRADNPDALGYSQFCNLYREWTKKLDVVMRHEHKAGERLFTDFAGDTIPIYKRATTMVDFDANLFVSAMGISTLIYAEALTSEALDEWTMAHVNSFEGMGAVPHITVPDNLRSAVTKAHRYEATINRTFEEMATHYGTCVIPARARKPRDKAKVENSVLLAERWIIARLRKRKFYSLGELNEAIRECVAIINAKPFKKIPGSRNSLFAELDRPAMLPLPSQRYEFGEWKSYKVPFDYHLPAVGQYWSAPHHLVGHKVEIRISARSIEIFTKTKRVASHLRVPGTTKRYVTDPAHMPKSHREHAEWTPERMIAWAAKTGPETKAFVAELLASRPHPEHGYRSVLGIIRLEKKHGAERVEKATKRARALRSYSYHSVESILKNNLEDRPLPERHRTRRNRQHDNIRGPEHYQ